MAQAMPRYCPRCGTPTRANMSYCVTCELPVEAMLSGPEYKKSWPVDETLAAPYEATPEAAMPTPRSTQQEDQPYHNTPGSMQRDFLPIWNPPSEAPHPAQFPPASSVPPGGWDALNTLPANPDIADWPTQSGPHFSPMPEPLNAPGNPQSNSGSSWAAQSAPWQPPASPLPSQPAQGPTPRPKGKQRMGVVLILLVILLLLGGGGYLAVSVLGIHVPGLNMGQATIKTSKLNTTVTYAGMDVTLLSAQQSQNFSDDPQSASDGMLRLNLQEHNATTVPINWDYSASARLIVQGKSALTPTYVKSKGSIAPGTTLISVVDFAVPNGGNLSAMTFQLGTAHEAQLQIPLNGQANLSQYQPKTAKQNGTTVYFGLNWTLTGSTTSLSIPGQQASSGMEYLTLNLSIDNTLTQTAISGSPFDYLHVKAGSQTASLVGTTLPVSFTADATGKTGTATFLVPQSSSACTLLFVSQDPGGSGQASIDFNV